MNFSTNVIKRILLLVFVFFVVAVTTTSAQAADATHNTKRGKTTRASDFQEDHALYYFVCASEDTKHDRSLCINCIIVSLAEQRLYAYSSSQLVAWSNCSTGKTGHETPIGTFKITQKHIDHYSSIYNNAPMPYFMRMTNDGVGMHAGQLPGYAASHGCIRLPLGMVKELYAHTASGTPVQVVAGYIDPSYASSKHPSFFRNS